jgi:agmatine deiminase
VIPSEDKAGATGPVGTRTPPLGNLGFGMPAEWAKHAACWMAWPQRAELWGDHLVDARKDYARVARTIVKHEPVRMVTDPSQVAIASTECGPGVEVLAMPIDDSWLRDAAPTFVINAKHQLAAAAFTFNAWGEKFPNYELDATLGDRIAAHRRITVNHSSLVIEGGGFLTDGEGTLITAETCVLNPNRNPGVTKVQAEAELRDMLGITKVIWLPGDITDTGTDGHVDGYLSYARPATLLWEVVADPQDPRYDIMAENRRVLELQTDARGRRFELVPIAEAPRNVEPYAGSGYCRSYVNLYLANGAVIAPKYGIAEDAAVFDTLRRTFPERTIEMVPLDALFRGGGGIHCITQQEPAAAPI